MRNLNAFFSSFRMVAQVDEDTDDEYLDDPIKLFDPEPGYSCQLQWNGNTNIVESNEETTYQSDDELFESDTECTPVYIKLVDCMKYPWYFKKYTQEILNKTNIYDLVSDSENDVDVEYLSDDNDCFIVNNVSKHFGQVKNNCTLDYLLKSPDKTIIKTKTEKRLATMKLKENVELQKALEQRNMNKIDFKRNTGLIGMIITQKAVNLDEQEMRIKRCIRVKKKSKEKSKVFADASYLLVADKMLSNVGTELIPISDNAELPHKETKRSPIKHDNKVTNKKMPIQYSLDKLSKKLLCHLKSKIIANSTHNNSEHGNTIFNQNFDHRDICDKTLNTVDKEKHSHRHVKNIKKTNKYKNNQIKAIEKMIKEMQDSEEIEEKQDKIDAISPHENANLNLIQRKIVVDVREPTLSFLPSSNLAKKNRDIMEISKNDATQKVNSISYLVNKPKTTSDLNAVEKLNYTSEQVHYTNTFKSQNMEIGQVSKNDATVKGQFSKDSAIIEEASSKNNNNSNENLTRHNSASHVNHESISHNAINNSLHIASIKSGNTSKKSTMDTSVNNVDKNFSTSNVHVAKNNLMHTNDSSKTSQNIDKLKPNSLTPSYSDNNTDISATAKNIKQTSVFMHNPSASAIVLRPHRVTNTQSQVRTSQPNVIPSNLSSFIPPQLYQHGLYLNFLQSLPPPPPPPPPPPMSPLAHSDREHTSIPRSTNCAMPNYPYPKILPPHSKRYQYRFTPTQCHSKNNSSQQSNIVPKTTKGKLSGQIPWRFSDNGSQILQESFNAKFGSVFQQKNNSQTNNTQVPISASTDKCTVIASNKDCLGKKVITNGTSLLLKSDGQKEKINSCKRPKSLNREEELIKQKTEMLEILNNATKRVYESPKKADEITVNTFKKPRLLDKEETASTDNNEKKIEQQKGYSPPILPIPTYEKMLDRVHKHVPKDIVEYKKACDKPIKRAPPTNLAARKEDTKKISLEEYKRRTFKTCNKVEDSSKKLCRKINDYHMKRQNMQDKVREIVNRFSTESDLGYDSDSTVIL